MLGTHAGLLTHKVVLSCSDAVEDLILPKGAQHGMDKYGGNKLHFIETILNMAWTVTVPDEYRTVPEAVAAVPVCCSVCLMSRRVAPCV